MERLRSLYENPFNVTKPDANALVYSFNDKNYLAGRRKFIGNIIIGNGTRAIRELSQLSRAYVKEGPHL